MHTHSPISLLLSVRQHPYTPGTRCPLGGFWSPVGLLEDHLMRSRSCSAPAVPPALALDPLPHCLHHSLLCCCCCSCQGAPQAWALRRQASHQGRPRRLLQPGQSLGAHALEGRVGLAPRSGHQLRSLSCKRSTMGHLDQRRLWLLRVMRHNQPRPLVQVVLAHSLLACPAIHTGKACSGGAHARAWQAPWL